MPVLAEEPCCPCHFHWYKLETMISCFSSLFFVHVDRWPWAWWSIVHATCQESNLSWWPSLSRWVAEGWRHSWKTMRAITTALKFTLSAPRLKSGIHWQTFAWRSIFSCGCHPSGSIQLQGSLASTFHAIPPRPQSRWWKSSKQISWNQRVIHRSHQDLDLTVSMSNRI